MPQARANGITLEYDIHGPDGGEPTLNPNLFALVRFARQIGYEKVNVTTNGRLSTYDTFARCGDCGHEWKERAPGVLKKGPPRVMT